MIAAIGVTLDFTDSRGLVFGILTFFILSLYFLLLKRGKRLFLERAKVFFLGFLFFILSNFNTIIYTEFIKPYVLSVGVSTVYDLLEIALQQVQPFYTPSGIMYWLEANCYISPYHANLILGIMSVVIGLVTLLFRKLFRKPITINLGTL